MQWKKKSGCHIGEVYIYLETQPEAVSDIKPPVRHTTFAPW